MARAPLVIGGLAALVVIAAATFVLLGLRGTPDDDPLLTVVPNAENFSPRNLPDAPVLTNKSAHDLAVDFGYRVGGVSYSYTLALRFPADAEEGTATLTARHAGKAVMAERSALRLWDAPRDAYAVAVQDRFDIEPAVPALCLKAVIGPSKSRYDLSNASLCVAQRDATGTCHAETLACGQIRSKS